VPDHIRAQDTKNKQGSYRTKQKELEIEDIKIIETAYESAYNAYYTMLKHGVAREMARMVLPVGQYTEFYFTVNLRALMHFLDLRADSHAQWEIQEYAKAMAKIFESKFPFTYKHFIQNHYKGDVLK
jgi:thymidylate synthase (FAD)